MIVCVLMMATGTTDPVRRATDNAWATTLPTLTIPGSDPHGTGTEIYCQVYGGTACQTWYTNSLASGDLCTIGEANKLSQKAALDNCTALMLGEKHEECVTVATACVDCAEACKDIAIQDVKDQILPASYFVFFLCGYLAVVVVWNNIMIAADDLEGITKILGLVFNGVLVLIAFIQVIMAGLAASNAADACNGGDDCVPTSLTMMVLIGLALMTVGGVCVGGVQINNNLLLRVGTLVMVFLSLICLLTGLIMGISSGAVMDDMGYYYDSNYPRLRAALERADNSFCKLRKADCSTLAGGNGAASPMICDEPTVPTTDTCEVVENSVAMDSNSLWRNMWSVASQYASDPAVTGSQPWLEVCETSGICIFCDEFYSDVQGTEVKQRGPDGPDGSATYVTGCTADSRTSGPVSADGVTCLAAANLDWKAAVTTPGLTPTSLPGGAGAWVPATTPLTPCAGVTPCPDGTAPSVGATFTAAEAAWAAALTSDHGAKQKLKCADTGRTVDAATGSMSGAVVQDVVSCTVAGSTYPYTSACAFTGSDTTECPEGCKFTAATSTVVATCLPTAGPLPAVTAVGGVAGWSDVISNYTVQKGTEWLGKRTKCEIALIKHTKVTELSACRGAGSEIPASDFGTYLVDCDACNSGIDFTFASGVGSSTCLSYFVGHYDDACASAGGHACRAEFTGFDENGAATQINAADKALHIAYMVDRAYEVGGLPDAGVAESGDSSSFCGYTDAACKAKIKQTIEGSMQTIGVIGAIFIVFFLAIMFLTLQGIKIYKGGDGDDDDDDDDDDDSDE